MSDILVLPLAAPLGDSGAHRFVRNYAGHRTAEGTAALRPRAQRFAMLGSGYRVVMDSQDVALINLSLSGAQVRGSIRVSPDQPTIVNIGWPQDHLSCAAIARVRWVQMESQRSKNERAYRMGLVFETWDVRRLKEIMQHSRRTFVPRSEVIGPW